MKSFMAAYIWSDPVKVVLPSKLEMIVVGFTLTQQGAAFMDANFLETPPHPPADHYLTGPVIGTDGVLEIDGHKFMAMEDGDALLNAWYEMVEGLEMLNVNSEAEDILRREAALRTL